MDFNTTFDGRKCDHTTRIPLSCKTPLERTLGELPCLCSAQNPNMLVNLSVSRADQAICAELSTGANNDGDGDGREKARTADGGTFARLCVRERRKVCRAQLENILDVQRRSDTTFPIYSRRALHMHVLERDFSIRAACMQHDCATCASMQRDAVTAAQSRFLATMLPSCQHTLLVSGCPKKRSSGHSWGTFSGFEVFKPSRLLCSWRSFEHLLPLF